MPYKVVGKIDINKHSNERTRLEHKYKRKLGSWRNGKRCEGRFDHKCSPIITCHHQMGRIGFADDWARENDMPLLIDERYWMPLCFEAHKFIELHPDFAKENGYSYSRLAKI